MPLPRSQAASAFDSAAGRQEARKSQTNQESDTLMTRVVKEQERSDHLIPAVPRHGGDARRGLLLAPPNGGDPRQPRPPAPQEADDPAAARRRPGQCGRRGAVAALGCDGEEEAAAEAEQQG